jgi:hypothetical protein
LWTLSKLIWSLCGSCQLVCAFAWFIEVRNTEPWINNPFFPVWYILHPHKGIPLHMKGDLVVRGNLSHPMLMEFSWHRNQRGNKQMRFHHVIHFLHQMGRDYKVNNTHRLWGNYWKTFSPLGHSGQIYWVLPTIEEQENKIK